MRKKLFYLLIMLFLLPGCGGTKSVYEQKRSLMILDTTEQPRNKKAMANSKKRQKKNKKKAKSKKHYSKSSKKR